MAWPRDDYVKDEIFPTIDDDCGGGTCTPAEDMTCHCQVTVTNSQAFSEDPADADAIFFIHVASSLRPFTDRGLITCHEPNNDKVSKKVQCELVNS